MEPEDLDLFLTLFIRAVNNIAPFYFSTHYNEAKEIIARSSPGQRAGWRRKRIGDAIVQTGERMFCYELYHQLRNLLDENSQTFQNVHLQGELQKIHILTLLERYELQALSGNFIPDLLLHSPGTAEFHPYVIEAKADRFLSWEDIRDDLSKICEFITRYHYQRGIFLTTAIEFDYLINNRIRQNPFLLAIRGLAQVAQNVYIVSRENEWREARVIRLSETGLFG